MSVVTGFVLTSLVQSLMFRPTFVDPLHLCVLRFHVNMARNDVDTDLLLVSSVILYLFLTLFVFGSCFLTALVLER